MKLYDVFISYRRSDGLAIAEELYRYLTAAGLRVFFDMQEMVDGHYFTTQIEHQLRTTPNYILVATDDVFRFRDGEDWVRREIEIALEQYEHNPTDRTLLVLTGSETEFPQKESLDEKLRHILDVQRVVTAAGAGRAEAFDRAFNTVTCVNRQNIWRASHRWLENSKRPGGRFANLSIVESILPNAESKSVRCDIPVQVSKQPGTETHGTPLFDAVSEAKGHLFLIGQGGIGKTTALMHLMNAAYGDKAYTPDAQIPVFVELSFAPDVYNSLYEGGKSSFIRRSIFKQLRTDRTLRQVTNEEIFDLDEVFMLPHKVAVDPINDILSRTTPAPEYLLLLDGFNEVSTVFIPEANATVANMVAAEIDMLMTRCPNVRVVLTSRSDESAVAEQSAERFYLSGVGDGAIRKYLEDLHVADVPNVMKNAALVETLKVPLFLTLYASLANRQEVCTQGEIFKLFFNERRKNITVYTVQDRLDAVEKNIYDSAGTNQRARLTAQMQQFILDFLLPEIAWYMERKGLFYLRPNQIARIIQPVLEDRSDVAVCGAFGKAVFSKFHKGSAADIHTRKVAEDILERLGPEIDKCTEKIINCCTLALGILQSSGFRYGFVHQHIRDYFAAQRHINTLRLAEFLQEEDEADLALECMKPAFYEEPVSMSVRRFLGEALGVHHTKPLQQKGKYVIPNTAAADSDRMLLNRALDIYRRRFNGEGGYGVFTLLKILTEVRGNLAGCDLSELDLTGCQLNGAGLGIPGLAANVKGAKLNGTELFFHGHRDQIVALDYSPDGKKILTCSLRGRICILDAKTGIQLGVGKASDWLKHACFVGDGSQYVTFSNTKWTAQNYKNWEIAFWDTATGEPLRREPWNFSSIARMELTRDRRQILIYDEEKLQILSMEDLTVSFEYKPQNRKEIVAAAYDGSNKRLLLVCWPDTYKRSGQTVEILELGDPSRSRTVLHTDGYKCKEIAWHDGYGYAVVIRDETHYLFRIDPISGTAEELTKLGYRGSSIEYHIRFSDTGSYLAVFSSTEVIIYETQKFQRVKVFEWPSVYDPQVTVVAFHDAAARAAFGTYEGDIQVWETDRFSLCLEAKGQSDVPSSWDFTPDGKNLATIAKNDCLMLWDCQTYTLISYRKLPWDGNNNIFSSPDGKYLCIHHLGESHILSVPELETLLSCKGRGKFNPDGKLFSVNDMGNYALYSTDNWRRRVFRNRPKPQRTPEPQKTPEHFRSNMIRFGPYGNVHVTDEKIAKIATGLEDLRKQVGDSTIIERSPNDSLLIVWRGLGTEATVTFYDFATQKSLSRKIPVGGASRRLVFDKAETQFALREQTNLIGIYHLDHTCAESRIKIERQWEIPMEPGLEVLGVDLRRLHPESRFTGEQTERLHLYGAIVDPSMIPKKERVDLNEPVYSFL